MTSEIATQERKSVAFVGGKLDPQNAAELMEMAKFLAKSSLKPKGLNTAEDCFLVMFYGQAYGFHPAEALQALHVIKGKVAADGQTMCGLIQSHPLCKDYRTWVEGEGDERAGCVQSWRVGRDNPNDVVRFTLGDARKAQLFHEEDKDQYGNPTVWVKYTDDMLLWKAVARDKRRNWADAHRKLEVKEDLEEAREERNVTPRRAPEPSVKPSAIFAALAPPKQRPSVELPAREPEIVESEVGVTPPSKVAAQSSPASDSDLYEPAPEAPDALRKAIWDRATQTSNAHKAAPLIEKWVRGKFGDLQGDLSKYHEAEHADALDMAISVVGNCRVDLQRGTVA